MSSTMYYADGRIEQVRPSGAYWTLFELQTLVGGYIEVVLTCDGRFMVLDEEGKLKGKSFNTNATRLYRYGFADAVCGTALVVDTKMELDGPDDTEEDDGLH